MDAILSPAVEAERNADSTIDTVSRLIAGAFSGALTGIFAMGNICFPFSSSFVCAFDYII